MSTLIGLHADRPVRRDMRGERAIVVKRYLEADGARIFDEHRLLWESSLGRGRDVPGLPEPIAWDDATRELVMEAVPGDPVGTRGDLGRSTELAVVVAHLLGDLHDADVIVARVRDASRVVASLRRKLADMEAAGDGTGFRRAVELLDDPVVLRRVAAAETPVTSHGDWSPRNVLADGDVVRLIDVDRLQMAGPAHDVAYWGAWAWATQLLAGRRSTWHECGDFMRAYVTHRPGAFQEIAETLWFHRAAALLRIAHGWSALADQPLQRRKVISEAARWAAQA